MANEQDMRTVMNQTHDHRLKVLNAAAINHRAWLKQVRIHKSIYHTLNLFTFDGIGKFFVAECWIPLREVDNVRTALELGVVRSFFLFFDSVGNLGCELLISFNHVKLCSA
jgi:V-type H+-transporting ATPase subunit a